MDGWEKIVPNVDKGGNGENGKSLKVRGENK
jgi:hypothetical protein